MKKIVLNQYAHVGSIFWLLMALLFFVASTALAGGAREAVDDVQPEQHHHNERGHDDHGHDRGAMALPHIDPVSLAPGERLSVVATTSIVGDVVHNIAADAAAVSVLMSIGRNPHSYEPTPRAIARMEDAHIVFVNGLDLEENLIHALESIDAGYVVPVSAGILPLRDVGEHGNDDHSHDQGDPHFWLDPNNVIVWAENIARALSQADPANHGIYQANADNYIARLEALDREIRTKVARIPRSRRKLVVDHVALGYFADQYGFEVIGAVIPSTTDQAEPSAQDIAGLIELIRREAVPAIFVGGTAGRGLRNLVDTVAAEVGRDLAVVELLTGSLAPAGRPGETYLEFTRYNAEAIVGALTQ